MPRLGVLLLLAVLLPVGHVRASPPFAPSGTVRDSARTLGDHYETELNNQIRRFRDQRVDVAVVLTDDFDEYTGRQWTEAVADGWRRPEHGLLLTCSLEERRPRVWIGERLADYLPEELVERLLRDEATPRIRAGDIGGGLVVFLRSLADAVLRKDVPEDIYKVPQPRPRDFILDPAGLLTKDWRARIAALLRTMRIQQVNGAVAVLPSSYRYPPEEWADGLWEHWQMDDAPGDRIFLLVLTLDPARLTVKCGPGLTGRLPEETLLRYQRNHSDALLEQGEWGYALVTYLRALTLHLRGSPAEFPRATPEADWERAYPGTLRPLGEPQGDPGEGAVDPEARAAAMRDRRERLEGQVLLWNLAFLLAAVLVWMWPTSRLRSRDPLAPSTVSVPVTLLQAGLVLLFAYGTARVRAGGLAVLPSLDLEGLLFSPLPAGLVTLWILRRIYLQLESRSCSDCGGGTLWRRRTRRLRDPDATTPGLGTTIFACGSCGGGRVWVEEFSCRRPWVDAAVRSLATLVGILAILLVPVSVLLVAQVPTAPIGAVPILLSGTLVLIACVLLYIAHLPTTRRRAPRSDRPRLGGFSSGASSVGRSY